MNFSGLWPGEHEVTRRMGDVREAAPAFGAAKSLLGKTSTLEERNGAPWSSRCHGRVNEVPWKTKVPWKRKQVPWKGKDKYPGRASLSDEKGSTLEEGG